MRKYTVNTKERKEEAVDCPGTKASVKETRLEQVFLCRPGRATLKQISMLQPAEHPTQERWKCSGGSMGYGILTMRQV